MARPGRKPLEDELRLRERIESLSLSGLRPVAIRDALASAQNAAPIELSVRQIQAYLAAIRRGWAHSLDPAAREAERAELVANTKDVIRVAASSSARYRDGAEGVGYLNTELRAIDRLAKLLGLNGPAVSAGRPDADTHELDRLSGAEQAARLRELALLVEETP